MTSNQQIIVSIISAMSGIIIAYIVNVAAKKVQKNKDNAGPADRMEQMFDGYERLIKQRDLEDERKARLMAELEEELSITRDMVKKLEHSLEVSRQELEDSREEINELRKMLQGMRNEYKESKEKEVN